MKVITKSSKTQTGKAKIVLGDDTVKVILYDENDEPTQKFRFDLDDVPEYVAKLESGQMYFVKISEDGTKLFSVNPWKAICHTKFVRFWSREGEFPSPQVKTRDYGPYLSFSAVCKITKGICKGAEYTVWFSVKAFIEDDNGNLAVSGKSDGKGITRWLGFLDATGYDDVKFKDNPLPSVQKALLKAGEDGGAKEFLVSFNGGYPEYFMDSLAPVAEDDDDEKTDSDEDEDENPRPRKNGKEARAPWDGDEEEPKAKSGKMTPKVEDDDDEEPAKKTVKKANRLAVFDDDEE